MLKNTSLVEPSFEPDLNQSLSICLYFVNNNQYYSLLIDGQVIYYYQKEVPKSIGLGGLIHRLQFSQSYREKTIFF